jgi:hypothetical protein
MPLPENPVSRVGDLWLCGKHRVLCGDATRSGDVARLPGERKPILMSRIRPTESNSIASGATAPD